MPSRRATPPTHARIRAAFPALRSGAVFLENAGGSQVPRLVADRMRRYLLESYVQVGAGYPLSRACTSVVDAAHELMRTLMNARGGRVILGHSTSALLRMLADCYADVLPPDREIVLAETGHEANLGPWKRLAARGHAIKWWRMDPATFTCPLEGLSDLLTGRTAIVALPHVSNLLGGVADVAAVAALAHRVGARVVADGVAYAPHRAIDVAAWDVDWYAWSAYKVYGPHVGILYGRDDALAALTGPNHFFVPRDDVPYKFELGGVSHEACAGLLGVGDYLRFVATGDRPDVAEPASTACDRATVERAYARLQAWEAPPTAALLDFLRARPDVRVVGPAAAGPERVGTISFVHRRRRSREIVAEVDRTEVGLRHGHMYAWHLCEALGLDPEDGVVRASLVHYNTAAEVERLIEILTGVL